MKEILKELKEKINLVIKLDNKPDILDVIKSLNEYNLSKIFSDNILKVNIELYDDFNIDDFKFHSLLTIQQAMTEITGLGLVDIHLELRKLQL